MQDYQEQPQPQENNNPHIADLVIEDMKARKQLGIKRYGTALQAFNGRDALQDAYEEQLDNIVYTKQWMMEKAQIVEELNNLREYLYTQPYTEERSYLMTTLSRIIEKFN